jgi:hypothetical protein
LAAQDKAGENASTTMQGFGPNGFLHWAFRD